MIASVMMLRVVKARSYSAIEKGLAMRNGYDATQNFTLSRMSEYLSDNLQ
jgi:hypothetical protein